MRKNKKDEKDLNLSYIKVDIHNHTHLTVDHFKEVHKMLKYDYHDALIRYDIDKMLCLNHELKESENILYDLLENPNEELSLKKVIRKYLIFVRIVRESFSAILNTQDIIVHFATKLTPLRIRILILLNEYPELTLKELIKHTGKSENTIRREIKYMVESYSLPAIKSFIIKGECYKGTPVKHYQITSYGKHLINYIEDMSFNERIKTISETHNDILNVLKEQKKEICSIMYGNNKEEVI